MITDYIENPLFTQAFVATVVSMVCFVINSYYAALSGEERWRTIPLALSAILSAGSAALFLLSIIGEYPITPLGQMMVMFLVMHLTWLGYQAHTITSQRDDNECMKRLEEMKRTQEEMKAEMLEEVERYKQLLEMQNFNNDQHKKKIKSLENQVMELTRQIKRIQDGLA